VPPHPEPPRPTDISVLSVQVVRGFIPWGCSGHCYFPQREGEEKIDPTQRFPGVLFADLLVNPREEWETEEESPGSILPEGHVWRVMSPTSVSMTAPLLHGNHFWG